MRVLKSTWTHFLQLTVSQTLEVTVWRDGKECHQIYFRGKPHKPLACKDLPAESADRTGTCIKFWPDSESTFVTSFFIFF